MRTLSNCEILRHGFPQLMGLGGKHRSPLRRDMGIIVRALQEALKQQSGSCGIDKSYKWDDFKTLKSALKLTVSL